MKALTLTAFALLSAGLADAIDPHKATLKTDVFALNASEQTSTPYKPKTVRSAPAFQSLDVICNLQR